MSLSLRSCFIKLSKKWKLGSLGLFPGSIWEKSVGSSILKVTALSTLNLVDPTIVLLGNTWSNSSTVG